jgi:hypothetical protein
MIALGLLFVRLLRDCFRPRGRLEAEIMVLRHQLNILWGSRLGTSSADGSETGG